jgi:hypothetical protein
MVLALLGWVILWKQNRKLFIPTFTYFLVTFYIVSCWTEWWYGASFSIRPLIITYPFLGLSLGYLLKQIQEKGWLVRMAGAVILVLLLFFNQFQYAQFRKNILDPYRTTPAYYKSVFLKTSVPEGAEKLLLINRDFSGRDQFQNPGDYTPFEWVSLNFEKDTSDNIVKDHDGSVFYRIGAEQEFALSWSSQFRDISSKDHVWFRIEFDARFPDKQGSPPPCLITTMERKEGAYGYRALEVIPDSAGSAWKRYRVDYLSPEIRNSRDEFKCYFWNRSKVLLDVDNFRITVFEP